MTNSDDIVSLSFDRGRTWSAPVSLRLPGDQFMPWVAYDAHRTLRIGTFDHRYNYSLATETTPGSLAFAVLPVSTQQSDPTRDDRGSRRR